jgi:hypothetical protein
VLNPEQYCRVALNQARAAEARARQAEEQRQMQQITQAVARGVVLGTWYSRMFTWPR